MDPEATINRMLDLRNIGVEVFIDDFGTGHSSLSYLKELPATTLKIDKSFIQHVDAQEEERRLIRSLVEIIKVRKKMVIVEGVSSPRRPASRALCPATFSRVTCSAPPCLSRISKATDARRRRDEAARSVILLRHSPSSSCPSALGL